MKRFTMMAHPQPPRKKRYARFTDAELQYIYLNCDFDENKALFRRIEKKIRRQIKRYRDF